MRPLVPAKAAFFRLEMAFLRVRGVI
jgi:hypothetical protein